MVILKRNRGKHPPPYFASKLRISGGGRGWGAFTLYFTVIVDKFADIMYPGAVNPCYTSIITIALFDEVQAAL